MFWRLKDYVTDYFYEHEGIAAILILAIVFILGFAITFGCYYLMGLVACTVYNAVAPAEWARFSPWIWAGAIWILRCIFKPHVNVKKGE